MKTATKKTAKNVIHFPTKVKAVVPEETTQVSYTLAANVYGFSVGDLMICETLFDLKTLARSALVVAETGDGRNVTTLTAAQILDYEILAVVVAYQRSVIY